jgi:hypothetical protein
LREGFDLPGNELCISGVESFVRPLERVAAQVEQQIEPWGSPAV